MQIEPVAFFHSPLSGKFGVPRQPGLAPGLEGYVKLVEKYSREEALRGLGGFSHIWLIWGFNLNPDKGFSLTVRPPRLGGNKAMGVFATRSPFRPNPLGLSAVRIEGIDAVQGIIRVSAADLCDGTPIYDIKPYVAYSDCIEGSRGGFVENHRWEPLKVRIAPELAARTLERGCLDEAGLNALEQILSLDPRPQFHDNAKRVYGFVYSGCEVKFRVEDGQLFVLDITKA